MSDDPRDRDRPAAAKPKRSRWRRFAVPIAVLFLVVGMLIATLCSGLYRLRDVVEGNNCTSNLRQLGLAIRNYTAVHNVTAPADWEDLANHTELTAEVFICPSSNEREDRGEGNDVAEWARVIDKPPGSHCSYTYVGRGLGAQVDEPETVVAFELRDNHPPVGIHVLLGDGHVETLQTHARPGDRATYERLLADAIAGVRPLRLRP